MGETNDSGLKWYADWETKGVDVTCKNNGKAPPYMTAIASVWLYATQEECCVLKYIVMLRPYLTCSSLFTILTCLLTAGSKHFQWKKSACMGTPSSSSGSDSSSSTATSKFFPDWSGSNKGCLVDTASSRAPLYMQSKTWFYDSAALPTTSTTCQTVAESLLLRLPVDLLELELANGMSVGLAGRVSRIVTLKPLVVATSSKVGIFCTTPMINAVANVWDGTTKVAWP